MVMNRINGCLGNISSFKVGKASRGSGKVTKKLKELNNVLDDKDHSHILWWKEVSHFSIFFLGNVVMF